MSYNLSPLDVCERLFGGLEAFSKLCGYTEKAGYAWKRATRYRNAGDLSPKVQRKALSEAAARGLDLRPEHVIYGATELEVRMILITARPPVQAQGDAPRVAAQ